MSNSNFENDHSFFGNFDTQKNDPNASGPSVYEYVFSSGQHTQSPKPPKKDSFGGRKIWFLLVTVFLSVSCSFAAGFGGALYANRFLNGGAQTDTDGVKDPPLQESIYHENPEDILEKSESATSPYGSAGEDVFSVSQVVQMVEDTVVVIDVTVDAEPSYFGPQTTAGSGSGVIISEDGYILTCHHVVEDAASIKVTLDSGEQYEAALVGSDAGSDLAVVKIQPTTALTYAEQGCSADLLVGEQIVAIGNPLGTLGGTVTNGIISATERKIPMSDGTVMTLLQTNAAINSGNSGGGLFNLDGKLIGIVNAKYAAEGVEGLAFAIPIDSSYIVQCDLIEYGYVRGIVDDGLEVLDINFENLSWLQQEQYKRNYGIYASGVYVVSSEYCSDLKNADRIIAVEGTAVNSASELKSVLSKYQVGDTVVITASRSKQEFTVSLTLKEYIPDYVKAN
ncbi:MAG: trypsin-like peptidase domain-containing protein [Clostridia bacterium]|nr:trypsin-like peptidase domain-containing protein [Clostridia bacterium]